MANTKRTMSVENARKAIAEVGDNQEVTIEAVIEDLETLATDIEDRIACLQDEYDGDNLDEDDDEEE